MPQASHHFAGVRKMMRFSDCLFIRGLAGLFRFMFAG